MPEIQLELLRTNARHPDFQTLVRLLDAELAKRDGAEHGFYAQYNGISRLQHALVAYHNGTPVSCGAIKSFDPKSVEVKRMYTAESARGQGIAVGVLKELEKWAVELGFPLRGSGNGQKATRGHPPLY